LRNLLKKCQDMSKLRVIEEARRKPKALKDQEKQKILEILKDVFNNVEEISLAVVHGGFVECKLSETSI